jgi:hypothetical protein
MIAPKHIAGTGALGAERQPRMATGAPPQPAPSESAAKGDAFPMLKESLADILPPLPAPPDPPGTAYVAAVLSGALAPKPTSAQEVYLRVGEWAPPDSPFRLTDKTI